MDGHDGLIADLEAQLQAAWARSDERAAVDLATSLRNDASLAERLSRHPTRALTADGAFPVQVVGPDHVLTADGSAIPFECALFQESTGTSPAIGDMTFVERLRTWARAASYIAIETGDGSRVGILRSVSRDHLVLVSQNAVVNVPIAAVQRARRASGGSTGAL